MNHENDGLDVECLGENAKNRLKRCGKDVKIYPLAKIVHPEAIEIGEGSMIDDFTFINGGENILIGKYTHIASFASIIGGGELVLGDYAVLSCGSRVLTGTDTYYGGKRMSTALPPQQRNVIRGKVVIERDAFIGTNSVVHPNVKIGEGAVIGSCSLVVADVEPWSINIGVPCKKIRNRPKITEEDISY
jgi:acetyltransferase-like isoleucine patch superfamily enzyme